MKGRSKTGRREFIRGVAAAGTAAWMAQWLTACSTAARHPAVGGRWTGWTPGEFQVHFIYTGVAESQFFIFPDGTTMLLDCGDHPACLRGDKAVKILPSQDRHAGEWIARYVTRVNPNGTDVDYMLLSHFHSDHSGNGSFHVGRTTGRNPDYFLSGFAHAAETLRFRKAIDRGWPDYADPIPYDDGPKGSLTNMKALYAYLAKRDGLKVEKFRLGARDQIVPLRGAAEGFKTFNFAVNGRLCSPKTGEVIDPYRERIAQGAKRLNENAMSTGTLFTYGDFTYFAAGDLSDKISREGRQLEDELAKIMPKVDVAKINHHGHHSMFVPLAKALDARCYVACVWDQLHCTGDTMAALEQGPGEHVYFPGIVPTWEIRDGVRPPWMAKAAAPCWEGAHTVLSVRPGGREYSMTLLSAADETMTVRGVMEFRT